VIPVNGLGPAADSDGLSSRREIHGRRVEAVTGGIGHICRSRVCRRQRWNRVCQELAGENTAEAGVTER
jgi:hypothetical protein